VIFRMHLSVGRPAKSKAFELSQRGIGLELSGRIELIVMRSGSDGINRRHFMTQSVAPQPSGSRKTKKSS